MKINVPKINKCLVAMALFFMLITAFSVWCDVKNSKRIKQCTEEVTAHAIDVERRSGGWSSKGHTYTVTYTYDHGGKSYTCSAEYYSDKLINYEYYYKDVTAKIDPADPSNVYFADDAGNASMKIVPLALAVIALWYIYRTKIKK